MTPLNEIIGQESAKKILLRSFNRKRLASTYLFYGPDGVGKWPLAISLAALANCIEPIKDEAEKVVDACGKCVNCRQILNLSFSELYLALPIPPHKSESEAIDHVSEFLEQKKNDPYRAISSTRKLTIPISMARVIKRAAATKPPVNLTRVIFFYQMEKMLPASADSLLKLIEEPPPSTIIILTTKDPENLLPTIQSRAQKISFKPLTIAQISVYLMSRYDLKEEKANLYARLAEGSVGRAIDMIEEADESPVRQSAFLMFKAILSKDTPSAVATVNDMLNPRNRGETEQILSLWQTFLGDLIVLKYGNNPENMVNIDLLPELEGLTARISAPDAFAKMVSNIKDLYNSLDRNVHVRPAMTALVFELRKYINQSS